jgi:hypothetical protein
VSRNLRRARTPSRAPSPRPEHPTRGRGRRTSIREKIFVERTKDEIKAAPEFDDSLTRDEEYRGRLGSYHGEAGGVGFSGSDEL